MKKFLSASLVMLSLFFGLSASGQDRCNSQHVHEKLLETNPQYAQEIEKNESLIQIALRRSVLRSEDVYTLPVVVHVLHNGEAVGTGTNISDAQIQSAIDNMNDVYADFFGTSIDTKVQFAFAQRDPNCNATNGINRVNASGAPLYSTGGIDSDGNSDGAVEEDLKDLSIWPRDQYYNIWVVSEIDDNDGGAGTQGYANYPTTWSYEGTVVLANAFGYDPGQALGYNLKTYTDENTTMVHEMGHALNLRHTFQGDGTGSTCPADTDCNTGDCVTDTPPHKRNASHCNITSNTCDGGSSMELVIHNFMDYSSCQNEFTSGQKDRLRAAIETSRMDLLNSWALVPPPSFTPPVAASCSPQTQDLANGFGMGIEAFTFGDMNYYSAASVSEGGYIDHSACINEIVDPGEAVSFSITVGSGNAEWAKIFIDYNNDGDFSDAGEEVFASAGKQDNLTPHTGTVNIPASPLLEDTYLRLRVVSDWNSITNSCTSPLYGQAEDYALMIQSAGGNPPVTDFSASSTTICVGESINFTDLSTESPTSWDWTFTGAATASSTVQNPSGIIYNSPGAFQVSLEATNASGNDTETKVAYITVNANPTVGSSSSLDETCTGNDGTATATGSGGLPAYSYLWDDPSAQTTSTATGLGAGSYNVVISDANSCSVNTNVVVSLDCAIPNTQLAPVSQNAVNLQLSDKVYYDPAAGATDYELEFTNTTTSAVSSFTRNGSGLDIPLYWTDCEYGYTYDVKVRAYNGAAWGNYSTVYQISLAGTIPTTQLDLASCGATGLTRSNWIYYDKVVGAHDYEVQFTNTVTSAVSSFTRNGTGLNMALFWTDVENGSTYDVRVRANVEGTWGAYGPVCQTSLTAVIPGTQLTGPFCGGTNIVLSDKITYQKVSGASDYELQFTNTTTSAVSSFTKNGTGLDMPLYWTDCEYGYTYDVQARANVGGTWGAYGAVCQISMLASAPATQLDLASCGATNLNRSDRIYYDKVIGADDYEVEFTEQGGGPTFTKTRNGKQLDMPLFWTAVEYNKIYDVRVRSNINGTWSSYGPFCTITMNAVPPAFVMKDLKLAEEFLGEEATETKGITGALDFKLYPNPSFGNLVHLELETGTSENEEVLISISDIYGKLVLEQRSSNNTYIPLQLNDKLAPGMYLVHLRSGDRQVSKRLIIK